MYEIKLGTRFSFKLTYFKNVFQLGGELPWMVYIIVSGRSWISKRCFLCLGSVKNILIALLYGNSLCTMFLETRTTYWECIYTNVNSSLEYIWQNKLFILKDVYHPSSCQRSLWTSWQKSETDSWITHIYPQLVWQLFIHLEVEASHLFDHPKCRRAFLETGFDSVLLWKLKQ